MFSVKLAVYNVHFSKSKLIQGQCQSGGIDFKQFELKIHKL